MEFLVGFFIGFVVTFNITSIWLSLDDNDL